MKAIFIFGTIAFVGCTKPEPLVIEPPAAPFPSTVGPLRLTISKAEVLSALVSHGFALTPEDAENQAFSLSRYRVADSSAVITFIEQRDELNSIAVVMQHQGPAGDGARAVECVVRILATVAATTPEQARQAIGETIATLGREATAPQHIVSRQTPQALVQAGRTANGDITILIVPSLIRSSTTSTIPQVMVKE